MGRNKFYKGVMLGAVAGGLLSLLDRSTRQEVGSTIKEQRTIYLHLFEKSSEISLRLRRKCMRNCA